MAKKKVIKKTLIRRIRRLMSACGQSRPEIIQLLDRIEHASGNSDYEHLFVAVDELCSSLLVSETDNKE